jgi:hypothetical protein
VPVHLTERGSAFPNAAHDDDYLHLQNAKRGCFSCQVVRV